MTAVNGNAHLLDKYKKSKIAYMGKGIIYVGLAVGVIAMGAAIAYGTANQQNYLSEDAVLSQAAEQGSFASPSGFGADLNKEQWHEDPFADEAAKVRAAYEKSQGG